MNVTKGMPFQNKKLKQNMQLAKDKLKIIHYPTLIKQ